MDSRRSVVLTLLVCLLACLPIVAQVLKGSLSGTITDANGAVIQGAQITATHAQTGVVMRATSDESGSFRMNGLPPGVYRVDVTAPRFKTNSMTSVQVTPGNDAGLGMVRLEVGDVSSTLEVTAESPLIETSQAQVTHTFSGLELRTFSGIQENQGLDNLALFVPGVTNTRSDNFSQVNGVPFSVNGLRGRNNDQQIDGQNNNDNSVGGPSLFLRDPEFTQQYVLITNQFGPEYGRNSGSVVNLITKSGSNAWHGNIYIDEGNSFLNALSNTQKHQRLNGPPRSNNEFSGFTIGGPILKNKLFFFGGFDDQISSTTTTFQTSLLTPTPAGLAQLNGCFPTSQSLQAYDQFGPYATSDGHPTVLPGTLVLRNVGTCTNVPFSGVERVLPSGFHSFNWIARTDLQLGSDTITARYLFNRNNSFNQGDNGPAGYFINVPALSQAALLSWTHNLSAHMVNELRGSYGRLNVQLGGNPIGFSAPSASHLDEALTDVIIQSGIVGFGPTNNLPQGRVINTWQAQDNWNYVVGRHNFKAGANWTYQRSPNIFMPAINGVYRFSNFLSFVNNTPNQVSIANGPSNLDFREHDFFLYVGDDWRATSNLTLNLGLTWSYFTQPSNLFHGITKERESGGTGFWNPALPLDVRTAPSIDSHKANFGPGIGFAYSPQWGGFLTGHGKTVFRGGYRLLYDPPFYNIYINLAASAPTTFLQTFTGASAAALPLPLVPTGPNVRAALDPFVPFGTLDPRTLLQTTVSPDFGPDKVHAWSFGFEREITKNSVFAARYVGNHGVNLFQSINGNPFILGLKTDFPTLVPDNLTPCPATQQVGPGAGTDVGRVNCGEGVVRERTNTGNSWYNALQLEFRANNLFKQLTLRTNYTWSKTTDNTSEIFSTSSAGNTNAFSQVPFEVNQGEHGLSGLDFPQYWTTTFVEQLPFFKEQHGWAGHLLGGWSIAGNYILGSGQPYTPSQNFSATITVLGDYFDRSFTSAFSGETARPFLGDPNAPFGSVGIFAGDACLVFTSLACGLPPTQLLSMNAIGASCRSNPVPCTIVPVSSNDVHFIINGRTSEAVFGTPFGDSGRNSGRDAISNIANASIYKNIKLTERASFEFHATMLNVFNHFNFSGIDPFVEDAGLQSPFQGFANPSVTPATGRVIFIGGKLRF